MQRPGGGKEPGDTKGLRKGPTSRTGDGVYRYGHVKRGQTLCFKLQNRM